MDLIVEPDIYAPGIDDKGNYIDKIPSFNTYQNPNKLKPSLDPIN